MSISIMSRVFYTDFPIMPSRSIKIKDSDKSRVVNISPSVSKIIMLAISDSADDSGENSWNSLDRLATKTNLNKRTVIRAVSVLVEHEYLTVTDISAFGTNNIKINIDKLGETPHKRPKAGRPKIEEIKTSGSESETSGSESETSGSEPPDSSLSIQNHPLQNKMQEVPLFPAKKNGRTKEEMLKSTEMALNKSLMSPYIAYAQFPEEILPVVDRMDKVWKFKIPSKNSKKGDLSYFINSCRDLLSACGEYGVDLLDEMRNVWEEGMSTHGGVAPFNVNEPQSLVKTMQGFTASKRRGEKYTFRYPSYVQEKHIHHSMLDI
jgi:hypothetical protein